MQSRSRQINKSQKSRVMPTIGLTLALIIIMTSVYLWIQRDKKMLEENQLSSPTAENDTAQEAAPKEEVESASAKEAEGDADAEAKAEASKIEFVRFKMESLEHGWIELKGGYIVTYDGGTTWEADLDFEPMSETDPSGDETLSSGTSPVKVRDPLVFEGHTYSVKQTQFITDELGWVLVEEEQVRDETREQASLLVIPLLLTMDGGVTWHGQEEQASLIAAWQDRQQSLQEEMALYASTEAARSATEAEWTLMPSQAHPGDIVLLRSKTEGSVQWNNKTYELKPFKTGYYTYLPIPMNMTPGEYELGSETLVVAAKSFETQYLEVSEQMNEMRRDYERIQQDQVKIDKARSTSADEFLFSEPFVQPLEGILTTPYGYTRYVNGEYSSSHTAIDVAAPTGTPIVASNDGVVAIADEFYLIGNAVYLDHGLGLFSQYAHMSELKVETGDTVKRGDVIGLVGSTGFSTGPHLHFTFWAHNVPVNPNLFFESSPFYWLKHPQEEADSEQAEAG